MKQTLIALFALGLLLAQSQQLPAPPPGDPANYILVRRPDGSFVYVPLDKHGHPSRLPEAAPVPAPPGDSPSSKEGGYQVVPPVSERPQETPQGGGHFVVPKP